MTELLTAAQMRAIEQAAIASGAVTGLDLMERAGRGVVSAIFAEWPELAPSWGPAPKPPEYLLQDDEKGKHRAVVLCGPGNNGGDGFVVARLLSEVGWTVEVFLYGDAAKLPADAKVNHDRWCAMGTVKDAATIEDEDQLIGLAAEIFVDALFGTGLTRPIALPSRLLGPFFDFASRWQFDSVPCRTVSIDLPSGICADSGRQLGGAMVAALTVTFHSPKRGHFLATDYLEDSGQFLPSWALKVVDIGLPRQHREMLLPDIRQHLPENQRQTVRLSRPQNGLLAKSVGRHKYSHGHALVLSGGAGKGGAARLAARGALRVGAGAVTVGCPPAALIENAAQLNAIMLQSVKDANSFAETLQDNRVNALCIGPGLGLGKESRSLVEAGLKSGRSIVLDADALTLVGEDAALFAQVHENCILTPHAGEFARLFPDIAAKLDAPATQGPAYSKVDATCEAAARAGCVVLFKGPDTVIADASGRCRINASLYERSAPWLATAGSGDVLAGFITGLLARGFAPMQAAETGAWLHTECALKFGPGLIAEDLPEMLPEVFRNLAL